MVPHARIGEYVTVARRERGDGGRWFVGSITNEQARTLELPLNFLEPGKTYKAMIYADAADADYERNPYAMEIKQLTVTAQDTLTLRLARSGGCAIRIEP